MKASTFQWYVLGLLNLIAANTAPVSIGMYLFMSVAALLFFVGVVDSLDSSPGSRDNT